nr:RdRp [signal crayfish associated chu-like virus 4]
MVRTVWRDRRSQATWTLATLADLKVALGDVGYKFEVSVKGDDCRAAIMIPYHECPLNGLTKESERIKQAPVDYCKHSDASQN